MSLKDWLNNGWLSEHKTSPAEIAELIEVADRDLKDCQAEDLSENSPNLRFFLNRQAFRAYEDYRPIRFSEPTIFSLNPITIAGE